MVFTGGLTALCREAALLPLMLGGAEAACGGAPAGVDRPGAEAEAGTCMDTFLVSETAAPCAVLGRG